MPESWSLEAADFINKCIRRAPRSRLGLNGIAEIKAHVWLKSVEWNKIKKQEFPAPWKPSQGIKINKK